MLPLDFLNRDSDIQRETKILSSSTVSTVDDFN